MQASLLGFYSALFCSFEAYSLSHCAGRNTTEMLWKDMSALYVFMHHTYAYFKGSSCIFMFVLRPPLNAWKSVDIVFAFFHPHWSILYINSKQIAIDRGLLIADPPEADIRVAWHRQCHFPLHCFCDISLVRGWNSTTFLTRSSPLSLPTQLTHSLYLQPRSATPSPSPLISRLHENACSISYPLSF